MPNLVFFLVLLFLLASYLRVDFFFTIIYLLAAVYLISRLWMVRAAANLVVERRFVDRAFLGDEVQVELRVRNRGWLPVPWVLVRESLPVDLVSPPLLQKALGLGPGEEERLHYSLNCRRRGYYPLGPLQFSTGDLLGIHESRQRQIEAEYLIIYPRVVPLERLGLPTQSPLVVLRAQSPLFEDPARIMGVRDYEVGDSPRRIHWTATASAGRLLVKQYEPAIARDTFICLDLGRDAYDPRHHFHATELAIVTAASIANHVVVREGLPVGLASYAWDPLVEEHVRFSLPLHKGRGHLMSLLEVLARVERTKKEGQPFGDLLRQESLRLPWGATLIVISGSEDPALFESLAQLRRSGFSIALILVQAPLISTPLQGRAELLNIPLYRVWSEEELEVLS
jgi:uncharacterized protein (DUF58 family)